MTRRSSDLSSQVIGAPVRAAVSRESQRPLGRTVRRRRRRRDFEAAHGVVVDMAAPHLGCQPFPRPGELAVRRRVVRSHERRRDREYPAVIEPPEREAAGQKAGQRVPSEGGLLRVGRSVARERMVVEVGVEASVGHPPQPFLERLGVQRLQRKVRRVRQVPATKPKSRTQTSACRATRPAPEFPRGGGRPSLGGCGLLCRRPPDGRPTRRVTVAHGSRFV